MGNEVETRVAIIGAGVSGLTCARALQQAGFAVCVLDKGRGPGGRTSTRRVDIEGVEVSFDHGAQYFTVRDPRLEERVRRWEQLGVVKQWDGRIAVLGDHGAIDSYSKHTRYVGVPGMNAMCAHLASGIDVRFGVTVGRLTRTSQGLSVLDPEGACLGEVDLVVVTAPPEQAAALVADVSPELAASASQVDMKPCWAVMAAFEARVDVPFDGAFVNRGPLSWVARTSNKPSRTAHPDRWVLHASAPWSVTHLERPADEVTSELLDAFFEATGAAARAPLYARAHRWRYAIAENPLTSGCLVDPSTSVVACGDWTHGNRVEGAVLAGLDAAERIRSLVQEVGGT